MSHALRKPPASTSRLISAGCDQLAPLWPGSITTVLPWSGRASAATSTRMCIGSLYTPRASVCRSARPRRLRLGEVTGAARGRLPERPQLPRPGERHPRRGELARRDQLQRQRGGTDRLSAPAALRDSEPGQIREEAALRIPRRCRGFLGRIAQRESARFTRERSLVQSQVRPSITLSVDGLIKLF